MRVQLPPSKCRSDSIAPRLATGPQRLDAGRNGGPWKPPSGSPVQQASLGSASEGVESHREGHPAQEADALELKRHRRRRRQPSTLTGLHCHSNPVESTTLRMRAIGTANGGTRHVLSRAVVSRCQPHGVSGGIPQEAKAEGNASDMLTCGRSCGSDRGGNAAQALEPTRTREGAIPRQGEAPNRRSQAQPVR